MAWTNITDNARITTHAAKLHGLVILASTTGGDVTVYAGQDDGGRKIGRFEGVADHSRPINFRPPLECESGIYVDVGSSITEVLVLWEPV